VLDDLDELELGLEELDGSPVLSNNFDCATT
jgi:hypothetical protein